MKSIFVSDSLQGSLSGKRTAEPLPDAAHGALGPCGSLGVRAEKSLHYDITKLRPLEPRGLSLSKSQV